MMERFRELSTVSKFVFGLVLVLVLSAGALLAENYLVPETAVEVDESLPPSTTEETESDNNPDNRSEARESSNSTTSQEESGNIEMLKAGSFEGKAGHKVSGDVKLFRADGKHYLRFENYQQTQGPDVFVYLTPSEDPDTSDEISEGVKIRIDGGPDGGEIVKEGNFNQKIPEDIDVSRYNGVGIWCDAFSTPFGAAPIE